MFLFASRFCIELVEREIVMDNNDVDEQESRRADEHNGENGERNARHSKVPHCEIRLLEVVHDEEGVHIGERGEGHCHSGGDGKGRADDHHFGEGHGNPCAIHCNVKDESIKGEDEKNRPMVEMMGMRMSAATVCDTKVATMEVKERIKKSASH